MLKFASRNAFAQGVSHKIDFMIADAKDLPFDQSSFDAVFCHNMLHHLPQPERMIDEIKRVVKKDGAVVIRDLVRHSNLINAFCVHIMGVNYNAMMRDEYRKSILAALSQQEWLELKNRLNMPESRLTHQLMTHMTLQRASSRRRTDNIKVVKTFYKRLAASFYISR